MIPIEQILLAAALFLVLGILGSKVTARIGVPALLLFLALGMVAGSDGLGGIYFDNPWLAQSVGVVSLAFILFSGGLDTRWREVRLVLGPGLALSTIGVGATALLVGWFAQAVLGFSWPEGILLGAIVSSTDAAAVFAVLRGRNVQLKGRLKPLLELESGSNDPMAVFLTIGMTRLVMDPGLSAVSLIPLFVLQMGIGALFGYLSGRLMTFLINRLRLEYDGLYPVLTTSLLLLTYGLTASVGGNGFLAVYLSGLMLARVNFIHRRSLLQFHDGLAWLMQIVMFVTLGLQVFPSRLSSVAGSGLLVGLFLMVAARPLSVFLALSFSRWKLREKLFISWVGLRGAAPIVLATFPLLAGAAKADVIFHLVFFTVLISVLLQGTLIVSMAKWLGVYDPKARRERSPLLTAMRDGILSNDLIEITVAPASPAVGQRLLDLQLPRGALIVLVGRRNELVVPGGGTMIEAGDQLLILAPGPVRERMQALLSDDAAVGTVHPPAASL